MRLIVEIAMRFAYAVVGKIIKAFLFVNSYCREKDERCTVQ